MCDNNSENNQSDGGEACALQIIIIIYLIYIIILSIYTILYGNKESVYVWQTTLELNRP